MSTRLTTGIRAILAAVIMTTCALLATSEAAAASGDPGLVAAGSNVRYGPGTGWQVKYTTRYTAWIPLRCWVDAQNPDGSWMRWFAIDDGTSSSWTWSGNVSSQPSLPRCW
jgi:hypothetical protein